jgi:hypothetical protein
MCERIRGGKVVGFATDRRFADHQLTRLNATHYYSEDKTSQAQINITATTITPWCLPAHPPFDRWYLL